MPGGVQEVRVIPSSRRLQELNCCCEVRSATGRRCVVVAGRGGIIARDVESGRVVGRAEAEHEVLCMTGRDGTVWVGNAAGHVGVYRIADVDDGGERRDHMEVLQMDESSHASAVMLIITSGDLVISASDDGSVCEWSSWGEPSQLILPPSDVLITALTSTSNTIIIADISGTIKSVDTYTHTISSWGGHAGAIHALQVVLRLQLWSAGDDGKVLMRSLPDGTVLRTLSFDYPVTSITPVGDQVWLWCAEGSLTLVSPLTLECLPPIETPCAPVGVVQVNQADVRRVWAPKADGSIGVWDVRCSGMDDIVQHVAQEGDLARRQVKALQAATKEAGLRADQDGGGQVQTAQEELAEERQRSEDLETTVKGLVTHCTQLQESLYAREKEVAELTRQRDKARVDRHSAEQQLQTANESIDDLKEILEDFKGVEDQAITQQEMYEDLQRAMLCRNEESARQDLIGQSQEGVISLQQAMHHVVSAAFREELLARDAVNRALRVHLDREHAHRSSVA